MHGGMGGGGMHFGGTGGGWHGMAGSPHFAAIGPGPGVGGARFAGPRFAGAPVAHAAFGPHFSHFAFHHGFFHHRFRRFVFVGAPYYADYGYYDGCWRRAWTGYGVQWVNVCGDYGDYGGY